MKGFEDKTLGNRRFLVYNINQGEEINPLGLFAVSTELLKGFCPVIYSEGNSTVEYEVSGKVTLNDFFSELVTKREILCILNSITDALIVARNKKVDLRSVVFDKEYVFVEPETARVSFVVLPLADAVAPVNLNGFLKNIVCELQYDKSENTDYVVELLNYLNSNDHFIYEDFKDFLSKISGRQSIEELLGYEDTTGDTSEDDLVIELEVEEKKGTTAMFASSERKELTAKDILGK